MTKNKRFTIEKRGGMFYIFDDGSLIPVSDGQPICDLLNELHEEAKDNEHYHSEVFRLYKAVSKENEQLKQDKNALIHLLENQSMIIEELHSNLLKCQVKEPIVLTKEDLNLMGKAIGYYTHGRYAE